MESVSYSTKAKQEPGMSTYQLDLSKAVLSFGDEMSDLF